jgi:hypothetical protein
MESNLLISSIAWAISGIIIKLVCLYSQKNIGKPNLLIGYKTPRSLASQENWEILNKVFFARFSKIVPYIFISAVALLFLSYINISNQTVIITLSVAPILIILAPVLQTFLQEESILKNNQHV